MIKELGDLGLIMLPTTLFASVCLGLEALDAGLDKAVARKRKKRALEKKKALVDAQIKRRKAEEKRAREQRMAKVRAQLEESRKIG